MDHIIEGVGSFGKYQYRIVFIVGLVSALTSALIYATIFIAAEPEVYLFKNFLFLFANH
jgi:hypothetical protein